MPMGWGALIHLTTRLSKGYMDFVSTIKRPIESELNTFIELFNQSLMHSDGLLGRALEHIRQRAGKRMRPMLILLMAKNFGDVSEMTQNAAIGL